MPAAGLVEELRVIKDKQEIDEIRLAARYAERGFAILRATLRPERTEKEVAADLEYQMRLLGAQAAASRRLLPWGRGRRYRTPGRPTRKSAMRDFVLVDWGATARHYKSDLTRVLVTAKISPKLERVYNVVLKAQELAIAAIKPGLTGREVDAVARGVIADAGFGRHFGHGLGHGLGLDIHEAPRLAAAAEQVLKPGMVVTVEPGIYLPGWGGVRIEDDILVTKTGCEVLTDVPKKLEEWSSHSGKGIREVSKCRLTCPRAQASGRTNTDWPRTGGRGCPMLAVWRRAARGSWRLGMSNTASNSGEVFDLKKLRQLVVLMNEHDLGEIDLRQGAMRIRLRKHVELAGAPVEVRHAGLPVAARRRDGDRGRAAGGSRVTSIWSSSKARWSARTTERPARTHSPLSRSAIA